MTYTQNKRATIFLHSPQRVHKMYLNNTKELNDDSDTTENPATTTTSTDTNFITDLDSIHNWTLVIVKNNLQHHH